MLLIIEFHNHRENYTKTGKKKKSSNALQKSISWELLYVSLRFLKIEHFFLFAIHSYSKNNRVYNILMIDLGKRKQVTAVLKI